MSSCRRNRRRFPVLEHSMNSPHNGYSNITPTCGECQFTTRGQGFTNKFSIENSNMRRVQLEGE